MSKGNKILNNFVLQQNLNSITLSDFIMSPFYYSFLENHNPDFLLVCEATLQTSRSDISSKMKI